MSVARSILRAKEAEGTLVPYVREGGFEAYTNPADLEKTETERPIMIADALEEVASSVPKTAVITQEMDAQLVAASVDEGVGIVKPGRIARQRREVGAKKEKARPKLPEVVVEPLEGESAAPEAPLVEPKVEKKPKRVTKKKPAEEAKPKKTVKKKAPAKEAKPEKVTKKKPAEKVKPEKGTKKKPAKKAEPKKTVKKKAPAKEAKPKKKSAERAKPKRATEKKPAKEAKPKKTTKKAPAKNAAPKKTTK
jgi:DNA-binding protein HU-beta